VATPNSRSTAPWFPISFGTTQREKKKKKKKKKKKNTQSAMVLTFTINVNASPSVAISLCGHSAGRSCNNSRQKFDFTLRRPSHAPTQQTKSDSMLMTILPLVTTVTTPTTSFLMLSGKLETTSFAHTAVLFCFVFFFFIFV
jgi:hypothetical protein